MRKTTLAPGQFLRSVHMKKSYLGKAARRQGGYPVLSVTSVRPCAEASKFFVTGVKYLSTGVKYMDSNLYFWFYSYRGGGGGAKCAEVLCVEGKCVEVLCVEGGGQNV